MTSEKYPSDKEIRTTYDTAGRLNDVKRYINDVLDKTYASQFNYAAHGAVASMQLGNGKWEHTSFNARLQPIEIGLGANSAVSDLLKLEYKYGVLVSNVLDTTKNNGNIQSQTITAPKAAGGNLVLTEACAYDSLNRLAQATETGGTNEWSQTYSYDRFGNRAVAGTIFDAALTPPSLGAFDSATNRIKPAVMTGFSYDTAGSLASDPHTPANGIICDAENRQTGYTKTGVGTTSYSYDGDGHRVKKIDPSNNTTVFVYNAGGQLIAEYTSGAPSGNGTSYLTSDHLGSTRVVTSAAGGGGSVTVQARYDYLPFGEEIDSSIGSRTLVTGYGASNGTRQKFTQKERDTESGLDYFINRYYSSAQGRFTSVDPLFGLARPSQPQSWNKYAYTVNNPLVLVDENGLDWGYSASENRYHYFWGPLPEGWEYRAEGFTYTAANGHLILLGNWGNWGDLGTTGTYTMEASFAAGFLLALTAPHDLFARAVGVEPQNSHILGQAAADNPKTAAVGGVTGAAVVGLGVGRLQSLEGGGATEASGASNARNGLNLNKSLASEQQVGEQGSAFAGSGTNTPFRDAQRVASEYGGSPNDWAKMKSSSHTSPDGTQFETHWVQNVKTGQRVEFKTKFPEK